MRTLTGKQYLNNLKHRILIASDPLDKFLLQKQYDEEISNPHKSGCISYYGSGLKIIW